MAEKEIDRLAKIIWDYHHVNQPLEKTDCLFVLGSNDIRVAEYASDLFLQGYAPLVVFSGGIGELTKNMFPRSEADIFAELAMKRGVPKENIIIENTSTNTGENISFTRELLKKRELNPASFILVQKPYMERRTFATFKKLWSEKAFTVTSPPISFADYPTPELPKDLVINIMVGDLQRIKLYAEKGFQIPQEITPDVWQAFERLVELGYDKHLVPQA